MPEDRIAGILRGVDIRKATADDVRAITSLGLQFIGKLKVNTAPDPDRVAEAIGAVVCGDRSAGFVAERNGQVVGFILGALVPLWWDSFDWSAIELAWWLNPEARGGSAAVRLVQQFEAWAAACGVHRVVLSDVEFEDNAHPAGVLIERLGYTLHERAFIKQL